MFTILSKLHKAHRKVIFITTPMRTGTCEPQRPWHQGLRRIVLRQCEIIPALRCRKNPWIQVASI